jgi:ABC-type polysaccharide transport system permease subunit
VTSSVSSIRQAQPKHTGSSRKLLALGLCAAMILILFLPLFPWFRVADQDALYGAMGLKATVIKKLTPDHSVLTFLSFVETSKQGVLGFWSFLLLIVSAAAILFCLLSFIMYLRRRTAAEGKGMLRTYSFFQKGMVLSFLSAGGALGLIVFANRHDGLPGFMPGFAPILVLAVSVIGYAISKRMEKAERIVCREHGFVEEFRRNWILFLFLAPCFVFFLINNYLPMAGIYFAFTQFNFRDHLFASPFVGFKNFEFLVRSEILHLTQNTILYNIVFIVVGNVLQIIFAILISHVNNKRLRKISQTMIFMPYFVSYVILRVLVFNMFEYEVGLINNFVTTLGMQRIDFYNTPGYWPWLITAFYLWKNIGYGMVVYLATITGISTEYYEAAQIDGANIYQQIRYITIPLLKPTFIILLLYALGGIMKGQFELFYQLVGNNGTLFNVTDIFDTYVYRITTTQPLSMGLGTAAGLFQSLFGFIVIMVTNVCIKHKNPEYALF